MDKSKYLKKLSLYEYSFLHIYDVFCLSTHQNVNNLSSTVYNMHILDWSLDIDKMHLITMRCMNI